MNGSMAIKNSRELDKIIDFFHQYKSLNLDDVVANTFYYINLHYLIDTLFQQSPILKKHMTDIFDRSRN